METEGVETVRLSQSITLLRGVCNGRFKFAIEYGNKRGTTENTYVIKVRHTAIGCTLCCKQSEVANSSAATRLYEILSLICAQDGKDSILIDVPDETFAEDYGAPASRISSHCFARASTVSVLVIKCKERSISDRAYAFLQCVRWRGSWRCGTCARSCSRT